MKQTHTIFWCLCALVLFSAAASAQDRDTVRSKHDTGFHNPSCYIDFQFPKGETPLVTTQAWGYFQKVYFEARYNYEARQTVSAYFGRSFKVGTHDNLEVIPMLGGSVGIFTGVSPATTAILEMGWVRGFSQNQYSFDLNKKGGNFFFDWTALVLHVYKPMYIGGSSQISQPEDKPTQFYKGVMLSIKIKHIFLEGVAYNFWEEKPMWTAAIQYNY